MSCLRYSRFWICCAASSDQCILGIPALLPWFIRSLNIFLSNVASCSDQFGLLVVLQALFLVSLWHASTTAAVCCFPLPCICWSAASRTWLRVRHFYVCSTRDYYLLGSVSLNVLLFCSTDGVSCAESNPYDILYLRIAPDVQTWKAVSQLLCLQNRSRWCLRICCLVLFCSFLSFLSRLLNM